MSSQVYAAPSTAPKRRRARARFGGGALGAVLGAFSVLGLFVAFPLSADQPGADASAAKAVAYWSSHSDKQMVAAAIFAVATGALVGFGTVLRDALRAADGGREPLARLAFAGIVIAATGTLTNVGITFTAADTAGHVAPQVTQTLSSLSIDFGTPMAVGFGLMMISSGAVVVRTSLVPRALGWLAILVGVAGFTPLWVVEFWGLPVWVLILSAALYLRGGEASTAR